MRKNSMIITVCLVICAFMAGCSGGQTSRISHLIENQANIDSVRIAEVDGPNEVMYIRLEDPAKIAAVINSVNGVHVKRLSAAQDNEFMQERILERDIERLNLLVMPIGACRVGLWCGRTAVSMLLI